MKKSKTLVIVLAVLLIACLVGSGIMYSSQASQMDNYVSDLEKAKDEVEVLRASISEKETMISGLETEKTELLDLIGKHEKDKERLSEDLAAKNEEFKTLSANHDEWGVYIKPDQIIGKWVAVDFLEDADKFDPNNIKSTDLYIKGLNFTSSKVTYVLEGENGLSLPWKDDAFYDDNTVKEFKIKTIDGVDYLMLEWKSGDYYIRDQVYDYYVFMKTE